MSTNRSSLRVLAVAGGLVLLALLVVGLVQLTRSSPVPATASGLSLAQMQSRLDGSPPPLAALHKQASELLSGNQHVLDARLAALRGEPLVINKWASWCGPCRAESAVFQRAAVSLGREVAFIGLDSGDSSRAEPERFLRELPQSYPSYYDPSERLGTAVTDSSNTPVTVFYDRAGGRYIHQGPYPSAAKLEADVRRYALGA